MRPRGVGLVGALALAGAVWSPGCAPEPFDGQAKVDSVRLFAARIDKPYAKAGDTVTVEVLATDARPDRPRPLRQVWLPFVCTNPRADLYYLCFLAGAPGAPAGLAPLAVAGPDGGSVDGGAAPDVDGGAPEAGAGGFGGVGAVLDRIPENVDLGPFLPSGPTTSFTLPADLVQARPDSDVPYGLAIVFHVACAGEIRFVRPTPTEGPQTFPIRCTDEAGVELPPSDWVIGLTRVYSYEARTNQNPVLEGLRLQRNMKPNLGYEERQKEEQPVPEPVDPALGLTLPRCTTERLSDCPVHRLEVVVPESSWELQEGALDVDGQPLRELVWVTPFSDQLKIDTEARLLFDATKGPPEERRLELRAPRDPGRGTLWVVVHDNRGGAAWATVPVVVE